MTDIIDHPSPNHDDRAAAVDMLVLHYTGMPTGTEALERLRDPAARVSAHYLVEEDGRIFRLVPEERRAWHAGISHWQGRDEVNDVSVGIEIVNPGHEWGYRAFPDAQVTALLPLCEAICQQWSVPKTRVVGHSDVAPDRKEDPGELFPWRLLSDAGLAIAPVDAREIADNPVPAYEACLSMLRQIGYGFSGNQYASSALAFQRHFIPSTLGKGLDKLTRQAIADVHGRFTND